MGYFSNGTEGEMYEDVKLRAEIKRLQIEADAWKSWHDREAKWCARCYHMRVRDMNHPDLQHCPVMDAHIMFNYDECNNKRSILHQMIPPVESPVWNGECIFFDETDDSDDRMPPIPPPR